MASAKTELTARGRDYVQAISSSAETLLQIIDDILDFSKVEAGKLDLESVVFGLRRTVRRAVELLGSRAREKDVELRLDLTRGLGERLGADPAVTAVWFLSAAPGLSPDPWPVAAGAEVASPDEPSRVARRIIASTDLIPVCMGSATGLRSTIPGAFHSTGRNCLAFIGPLPSTGCPSASTTRPIISSPTGTWTIVPVHLTGSPSLSRPQAQ